MLIGFARAYSEADRVGFVRAHSGMIYVRCECLCILCNSEIVSAFDQRVIVIRKKTRMREDNNKIVLKFFFPTDRTEKLKQLAQQKVIILNYKTHTVLVTCCISGDERQQPAALFPS
jgi:hypothetical protein